MKALITGGHGFVGRHLARHLAECGDVVAALDRADGFDVTDPSAVDAGLGEHAPEVVYHLAARSHVGESWDDPAGVFRVNAEGALNVLEASRHHGVRRVVVVGSAEVYGKVAPDAVPLAEDAPLRPATPYGASKVAAEFLALQATLGSGLETVRTRSFNHTGPGQSPRFVVPALARRVAEAEGSEQPTIRVGALDPVRDLTDVRDVVRAYRLLALHGEAGEVYNVCSGTGTTIRAVAEGLVSRAARPLHLDVDPDLVRPVEVPILVGDCSRLVEATGWAPSVTLDAMLDAAIADARADR